MDSFPCSDFPDFTHLETLSRSLCSYFRFLISENFLFSTRRKTEIFIYPFSPINPGDKNAQKGFSSQELNLDSRLT